MSVESTHEATNETKLQHSVSTANVMISGTPVLFIC